MDVIVGLADLQHPVARDAELGQLGQGPLGQDHVKLCVELPFALDERQTMAIGGNHPDSLAGDFKLRAVERVPRGFLSDGVNDARDEAQKDVGWNFGVFARKLFRLRKVPGLDALQLESRAVAGDRRLMEVIGFDFDLAVGERFDDLHQLARRKTDRAVFAHAGPAAGRDREVEVGFAPRDSVRLGLDQQVRKDRDHLLRAGHALQRVEFVQERSAINFDVHNFSSGGYAASAISRSLPASRSLSSLSAPIASVHCRCNSIASSSPEVSVTKSANRAAARNAAIACSVAVIVDLLLITEGWAAASLADVQSKLKPLCAKSLPDQRERSPDTEPQDP